MYITYQTLEDRSRSRARAAHSPLSPIISQTQAPIPLSEKKKKISAHLRKENKMLSPAGR